MKIKFDRDLNIEKPLSKWKTSQIDQQTPPKIIDNTNNLAIFIQVLSARQWFSTRHVLTFYVLIYSSHVNSQLISCDFHDDDSYLFRLKGRVCSPAELIVIISCDFFFNCLHLSEKLLLWCKFWCRWVSKTNEYKCNLKFDQNCSFFSDEHELINRIRAVAHTNEIWRSYIGMGYHNW